MPFLRYLVAAFIAIPLLEIYLIIKAGNLIGPGPTILLIILTAVLGAFLLRYQGVSTAGRARAALNRGELPARELVEGMLLLVSGVLLLTPGFVTDGIGFIILITGLRQSLASWIIAHLLSDMTVMSGRSARPDRSGRPASPSGQSKTLEGDYTRKDDME